MASLEYIDFNPWRDVVADGQLVWHPDKLAPGISRLPQIFWDSGEGWAEANHWALEKVANHRVHLDTAKGLMKHLHAFACYLEKHDLDWRHFPTRLSDRAVVQFRGDLMQQINSGSLASSTARSRINAVVQFYRHAAVHDFVNTTSPMWRERSVVIRYFDVVGFKRSLTRFSTDLAIPNRRVVGARLEDGLFPLSAVHMTELLKFTRDQETTEFHLMLAMGFFTGARLGTITTFQVENLEQARPDPYMRGFVLIRIGPGTKVATKFDVEGDLLVPGLLFDELKRYAYSTERLKREAKASKNERSILFLTNRGNRYSNNTVSRMMVDLRRSAVGTGLTFMDRFKFHQTRATYGTWLMKLALSVTSPAAAIAFVRSAMFHKHEATTFRYVQFLECAKGKQEAAQAFHEAFTGLCRRDWNKADA
jgi:integrase